MTKQQIFDIFRETGVLSEGHFALTSGRHSDKYMQCARLFQNAAVSEKFAKEIAGQFTGIDLVAGPAVGGIILAYEVSRQLRVPNIFAERESGRMVLRRGFSVKEGARVLVVEDVVTTGGSVKEVMELLRGLGAVIAGVGSVADRSNGAVDFGVPFKAVLSMEVVSYPPEECPLCKRGLPVTKPGSRGLKQ
ncbi:MAG: orotate phosphoribosyltransferase [Christensenellales bacterium]